MDNQDFYDDWDDYEDEIFTENNIDSSIDWDKIKDLRFTNSLGNFFFNQM